MRFDLTEDQEMLRQMTRDFARSALSPEAPAWDAARALPDGLWATVAELGLAGVCLAERFGGAGMGLSALALAIEELAVGEAGLAATVLTHNALCVASIERLGDDTQRKTWLPGLASGKRLGTWAGGGFDGGPLTVRATRTDAGWRLEGSLPAVSAAGRADVAVVLAATRPGAATAFVLDRGDWQAVDAETVGLRTAGLGEFVVDGLVLGDERRLGPVHGGLVEAIVDRARVCRAALAVGIGRAAFAAGNTYAAERKQFGRPLTDFQAIQWMIADGATELDAARLLYRRAAMLIDAGEPATAEAAMARVFATEKAQAACDRALQMHGGYGYTRDYPAERHWRDAYAAAVGEGTHNGLQRLRVARALLVEAAEPAPEACH